MSGVSYNEWNRALCEYFFQPNNRGKIVYLYVSEQVIRELGTSLGLSEEDLMDSFSNSVKTYTPSVSELFERASTRGRRWYVQGQVGDPPFIGLLALTVLAATRMGADLDEGIGGGNYYIRLRQLLDMDGQGRPRGFEHTEELWKYLREWQKANYGKYGYTNAFPFGNKYIGYPKSQCLIRDSERPQLYEFFYWAGYQPHNHVAPTTMQDHLELYLSSRVSRLSKFFSQNKKGIREAITSIVYNEFQEWDGTSGNKRSKANRPIRPTYSAYLVMQLTGFMSLVPSLTYFAPIDEDDLIVSESQLALSVPGFQYKNHALSRSVEKLDDLRVDQNWLCANSGIQLHFLSSDLFVFRKATDFGLKGWINRSELIPGQEHIFLYHEGLERQIDTFVQENGCKPLQIKIAGLPEHWKLRVLRMGEELKPGSVDLGIRISHEPIHIVFDGGLRVGNQEWLLDAPPRVSITAPYGNVVEVNDAPVMCVLDGPIQFNVFDIWLENTPRIYKVRVAQVERSVLLRNDHLITVDESNRLAGQYTHDDVDKFAPPFQLDKGKVFVQSEHARVYKRIPQYIDAPAFHVDRSAFDLGISFSSDNELSIRPIDLFVEYLSIRQTGNWNAFVKGLRWCFGDDKLGLVAYRVRRCLSQLGIVDFQKDGDTNRYDWWVSPTSVAAIPSRDNLVSLTGARTRSSIRDWMRGAEGVAEFLVSQPVSEYHPLNVYILAPTVDILEGYLSSLNITFNWGQDYFAFDLLRCLPTLQDVVFSSPGFEHTPKNWQQRGWDSHQHRWTETNGLNLKLTQYTNGFGARIFLLNLDGKLIQVDRDIGKLYVASLNRSPLMFYSNYCFMVRKQYAMPDLYDRVLVSCSGEAPDESGPYIVYKNVPLEIALPVAFKLGFELQYT